MHNKRIIPFLLIGLFLLALFLFWKRPANPIPPENRNPVAHDAKLSTNSLSTPTPRAITEAPRFNTMQDYRHELSTRPARPEPSSTSTTVKTPETELQRMQMTFRHYRAAFGQNPVGSNPEITRALLGKNATGAKFLDPASIELNPAGEWIDDWGTPYFFHAVSGSILELRSAGPDRKLFTTDDLVR